MTALDFSTILPELVLAIFALGALMAGAYFGKDALARPILWATVAALLLVGLYVGFADRPSQLAFFGMFADDAFARFAKVTILISAAAVLAMSAEYMARNPAEFVDFNVNWSVNLSYSLTLNRRLKPDYSGYTTETYSSVSFNNSFNLTPKWNFSTQGFFDVTTTKLTMFTMSIAREMHCWQMAISVTPIGSYRFFNISISPKSGMLRDLRINRTRTFYNY